MKIKYLLIPVIALGCMSLARPGKEFRIFQFPKDKIPSIDGDFSDWKIVPESYTIGLDELKNTRFGEGDKLNPLDFDIKVKVGWVRDLNRLYFFIDAYDDFWDFNDPALKQDIFELVVDGDLSGGPFINEENGNINVIPKNQLYFKGHGAHAQNYHVFTPVQGKDWAMVWGSTPWIKEFPYADAAYNYNFKHGENGRLLMEFYVTPFDHASYEGPEHSIISSLRENEIIGMSWSMLDFDGKSCESFMNLSHDWRMINDASYLCAFRLMPLEKSFKKPIEANWKFYPENVEKRIIRFDDASVGEITGWHWDFGDRNSSTEQNPVHQYSRGGLWTVVLTVEGPAGKSVRSKVWEVATSNAPAINSTLNEAEFRDRVYACLLGKNIGGTLGMPFEGKTDVNNIDFYTRIKEGAPAANDDLDLQILWLKAMEENNCRVDAYTLGEYWLKYVPVDWNEYGVGKANMRSGIMPPLSGDYNNAKWKTSNGAWIRSEIWACLAPGNPLLAAQFAWNDACVDHGCTEGTFAEIFMATLESAAFIEKDMNKLIQFALSMIPDDCRVKSAVNTALDARKSGLTWQEAREAVITATMDLGWFQAPRNVAFTMIGWLYGGGDFGKSICIAVNCGDDTDCTGATLGSIFGIIYGSAIIPERWKAPIGDGIVTVAVSGFQVPANLQALTDKTVAMQKKVAEIYESSLRVSSVKTNLLNTKDLLAVNRDELQRIWQRSPYQVTHNTDEWSFTCDYAGAPEIRINQPKVLRLSIFNKTNDEKLISFALRDFPAEYSVKGLPDGSFKVIPQSKFDIDLIINASSGAANANFLAEINDAGKTIDMRIGLIYLNAQQSSDTKK